MPTTSQGDPRQSLTASPDELLAAALERGEDTIETGRFIVTFQEGAPDAGKQFLSQRGMAVADARDFADQAVSLEGVGDAEALFFPEAHSAVITGGAAEDRGMTAQADYFAADSGIEDISPEIFQFAEQMAPESSLSPMPATERGRAEYLRGFKQAAEVIGRELFNSQQLELEEEAEPLVLGATWGLAACKVPSSTRSGIGIKVAVLDTGLDLGHPDFTGRQCIGKSFVGQPVQDLHGHGTHCTGTACGPQAPPSTTPRYGIGYRAPIFIGKVLTNAGTGTTATVLAGMNWAIANRCPVISMSLGARSAEQAAYTAAGRAALNNGLLIVAAAGNNAGHTGAPANSPTIMAVAALDQNLAPSAFSDFGKIEIAAPGRDVFSSVPRPRRYATFSGTSMATPHVSGCAALWAQTSPGLRGRDLWRKLQTTARRLPFPASRVGAGLVQAPS
jgi:subtilisin